MTMMKMMMMVEAKEDLQSTDAVSEKGLGKQ
jgi:hypothetical protein